MNRYVFTILLVGLMSSAGFAGDFDIQIMEFPGGETTNQGGYSSEPNYGVEIVTPAPQEQQQAVPPQSNSRPFCVSNAKDLAAQPSMQPVADFYQSTWKGNGLYHGTLASYDAVLTIRIKPNGTYVAEGCADIPVIGKQCKQMDRGTVRVCEHNGVITMTGESVMGNPGLQNQYDPNNPTFLVEADASHGEFRMKRVR